MPKTVLRTLSRNRFQLIIALISFACAIAISEVGFGQVSDSELNQLAREAASNRESMLSPPNSANSGMDFFSLLIKGGVFMIPIGLVSLLVVTFVFDRAIGLRSGKMLPSPLRRSLAQLSRHGDLDPRDVYRLCGESNSAAARIFKAMVLKTGRPQSEMHSATAEATQREVDRAYSNVRWLNLSAGIAPLLGLLGTVWGLIRAFHDTTQLTAGQNRADFLAVGIYEALVTTLAGLIVAIPAAVASHYFEGRITTIFGSIEEMAADLMMRLERYEGKARFEPIGRELAPKEVSLSSSLVPPPVNTSVPAPALKKVPATELRPRA